MEENTEMIVENTKIAESVSEHINFDTLRSFLVKPLDPIKVKKEFSKPIPDTTNPTKDENGVEATDYKEVETEIKEVDSDYRKGIILKIPYEYERQMKDEKYPVMPIKVGDTIIYTSRAGRWFDLLKDSQLVDAYSIVAVEK